jgi:hypothetical protein
VEIKKRKMFGIEFVGIIPRFFIPVFATCETTGDAKKLFEYTCIY